MGDGNPLILDDLILRYIIIARICQKGERENVKYLIKEIITASRLCCGSCRDLKPYNSQLSILYIINQFQHYTLQAIKPVSIFKQSVNALTSRLATHFREARN